MLENSDGRILLDEFDMTKRLADASRRLLMGLCSKFSFRSFKTDTPSGDQKTSLARAIIKIFPCLKAAGENELVINDLF